MTMSADRTVLTRLFDAAPGIPLVMEPAVGDVALPEWLRENHEVVESYLRKHGAVLFRNFQVGSAEDFEEVARAICPVLFREYGDLPREGDSKLIYKSTPYPQDRSILFHNESSHLSSWPMKQFFSCIMAASAGGETPIVDCRTVHEKMRPELVEEFARRKIRYVRNFIESFDVSWSRFYGTDDPAVVERKCAEAETEFEWMPNGTLRTWRVADAVLPHPRTGEMVFFNQLGLHHISCLDSSMRQALLELFGEEGMPRNVYWGDGERIPDEVVAEVCDILDQESVAFRWEEGDVLMLDNMLVAHARNPFEGERKVVVALGEMMTAGDSPK
ncbi:TauD/TfdA family dioxygenase [Streptomyces sp. NBC_01518]|uniref:TauD/TfdA family dioxygenase n=1 Tax=Streptomyces sp. NBC_01518 TaxID=2903891 RepID=UPI0038670CB9